MNPPRPHPLSFAQVGCGLIGRKRALAIGAIPEISLGHAIDTDAGRAEEVARLCPGCRAGGDLEAVWADKGVTAVLISTPNAQLVPTALEAARRGKHALIEKPGGLNAGELRSLQEAARKAGVLVRVSYNHRFHPALQKARELVDDGALGPLMFIRGRYGHGGRKGYDREWRADPGKSGGGELIDQGVHLIDLASWFLGNFSGVEGHASDPVLGHDGGRQRVPEPADGGREDGMAPRELHGVEEPVLLRNLRPQREDRDRRPGRQLRGRAAGVLPDAAGDGPAGDDDLGVPAGRRLLGAGAQGLRGGHPARAGAGAGACARGSGPWRSSRPSTGRAATPHDHHSFPSAGLPGRRRHRPAVLLPRIRRIPGGGGDRQVRLHHPAPDVPGGDHRQVLQDGAGMPRWTRSSIRSCGRPSS